MLGGDFHNSFVMCRLWFVWLASGLLIVQLIRTTGLHPPVFGMRARPEVANCSAWVPAKPEIYESPNQPGFPLFAGMTTFIIRHSGQAEREPESSTPLGRAPR